MYKNVCAQLSWTSPPKKIHINFQLYWSFSYVQFRLCSVQLSSVISLKVQYWGHFFFSICVNTLPLILKSCQVQLYADDTVIYASNSVSIQIQLSLQSDFNMLQDWLLATKKKSYVMIFGSRQKLKLYHVNKVQYSL